MKIDIIKSIIALGISAIITYGFYSFHQSDNSLTLVFTSFIELFITSFFILGLKFELSRTTINVRTVSSIFFFIFLVANLSFSFFYFSKPLFIIINGILVLIYVLIIHSIVKVKQ